MGARDYLGEGGRLEGGPAPELVRAGYAVETGAGPRLAWGLSLADIAHAVMLAEAGVLADDDARALLRGLLELHEIPGDAFPWRPELGDAFNSREAALRERVGRSAAGWLSAGRPRREAFRVGLRLVARAGALDLHDALADLAEVVAGLAERHANELAADHTYLQPAQPSTVGHLLLTHAYPALRDAERVGGALRRLDLSVAGAGGSAGSRWPIDRERLAGLLGCAGLVVHAKDAAWAADAYLELVAATATAATHQAQLGQDLEILASQEFGAVRLADRHSRASALMPQKRNPYALAIIRAQAGAAAGELCGLLVGLHTGSARTDHFHLLNGGVPRLLGEAVAVARLTVEVVGALEIEPERWAAAARAGFITAADVADELALTGGIDYRSAHAVVGRAVRGLVEAGRTTEDLTPELLSRAAEAAIGRPVAIDADRLAAVLDPAAAARSRRQTGSSSPSEVAAMIAECRSRAWEARARTAEVRRRVEAAEAELLETARRQAG
jgi:argininosuccinate lyase